MYRNYNERCEFSIVTQQYLEEFRCILDRMIMGMTSAELTDSISHNFIVQMIPHHEAAIEMSENLLKYTTNIPLQNIALGIVKEQTKSIADMREVMSCCMEIENDKKSLCDYQKRMDRIMEVMFNNMHHAKAGNDINCNFIREMIPHHMGAVEMSQTTLSYCICPQLKPILQAIITSQKKGIMQMRQLMKYLCN